MGAHWQTAAHDLLCSRYLLPSSTLCTDGVQTLILGSTSAHPLEFADLSRVKYLIPSELEKKNELCHPPLPPAMSRIRNLKLKAGQVTALSGSVLRLSCITQPLPPRPTSWEPHGSLSQLSRRFQPKDPENSG